MPISCNDSIRGVCGICVIQRDNRRGVSRICVIQRARVIGMRITTEASPTIELPECIWRAMRFAEMNYSELGEAIGASRDTISRWVGGRSVPKARDLAAIERATGLPDGWFDRMVRPEGFEPPAY